MESPTSSSPTRSPFGLPEKESECYKKLILVLLKILEPDFKTSDDTVLHKLLDQIRKQGNQSKADNDVLMRILSEWIKKVCESWSLLLIESKVFALKVAGYIASNSTGYNRLFSTGSLTSLLSHLQDPEKKNSNAINLGFVCLLESIATHTEGITILTQSESWRQIVDMALTSSSIYCLKQSTKLLTSIFAVVDDPTALAIMQEITAICVPNSPVQSPNIEYSPPYKSNPFQITSSQDDYKIINTLYICRKIISGLMDVDYSADKIKTLISSSHLTDWTWGLIHNGINSKVLGAANKLICVIHSLHFYQSKDENDLIPFDVAKDIMDLILKHVSILKTRSLYGPISDVTVDYFDYLNKFGGLVAGELNEYEETGKKTDDFPFCIHNFLFICEVLPVMMCIKARKKNCWIDILEEFIDKVFRITNSKVMRFAYSYRDGISTLGEQLCELGMGIMIRFTHLCPIMRKEQAILVFQALIHLLEEFNAKPEEATDARVVRTFLLEGDEFISKYPRFLSATLICLHTYLNKFDFSWRDSLESLCLLAILQSLLDSKAVTPMITGNILKCIDIVLQKFMPPNLALLVDTIKGSSIEDLGPQLFRLLHSVEWAVRDSTLEIVKTISSLSESRFPAFQTLLIDNKLPEVVFSIIETDHEPFVRSSAISCLREIAKVPNVWNVTLTDKNVLEKLLIMIHYETEGIVRLEAVKTIEVLYKKRKVSPHEMELIYDTMSWTAQNDFYWEVKIACLTFFQAVMQRSIGEQGMTDGVFPEVVFSKEKKKIIKLTQSEIRQSVHKALNLLGNIGCLQVLWDTFNNEPDLQVQRKSAELIKKIQDCPQKFSISWDLEEAADYRPSCLDNARASGSGDRYNLGRNYVAMDISATSLDVDNVIDQIVDQPDLDLLTGLIISPSTQKTLPRINRIIMSDKEFLRRITSINLEQVLNERSKWMSETSEGIMSLLDDILLFSNNTTNRNFDRNSVDCY